MLVRNVAGTGMLQNTEWTRVSVSAIPFINAKTSIELGLIFVWVEQAVSPSYAPIGHQECWRD
jgi:hypothetical protein